MPRSSCIKALPKMVKAANHLKRLAHSLRRTFTETEAQVERLNEGLKLPRRSNRGQRLAKGMMGLLEEGDEVIADGKEKDEAGADLALIGCGSEGRTL